MALQLLSGRAFLANSRNPLALRAVQHAPEYMAQVLLNKSQNQMTARETRQMAEKEKDNEKTEDNTAGKGKKKNLLLFVIIGVLVVVAAAGGGAFFFLFSDIDDEKLAEEISRDEASRMNTTAASIGVMLELEPFVVNLADPKARHFLKASITLELRTERSKEHANTLLPMIRNDIIMLLSSQTLEDVITMEGKISLRDEIVARVTRILGEGYLRNVYFSQFVVQ
jgi:flagellar FliL protein